MRSFVEANQEIGRMHVQQPRRPGAGRRAEPGARHGALTALIERAVNGLELPDYAGVPDSGAPAGPPITSSARP